MIEAVTEENLVEVLPLIRKYQEFYKVAEIDEVKNEAFFSQFGPKTDTGCLFLFRHNDTVVGFATVYFSFTSTIASKVGVLNDLYVDSSVRRQGVAQKLLKHCHDFAINKGAARLQWVTALDNEPAQKLYDSLPANKSTWHFYTYNG